jgi:hypothetical protein
MLQKWRQIYNNIGLASPRLRWNARGQKDEYQYEHKSNIERNYYNSITNGGASLVSEVSFASS